MNKKENPVKSNPEYYVWCSMKERCYNSKANNFKNYGGRGILICDRWKNSFNDFLSDMGKRPTKKHSLGRIENDGNYEPNNCAWQTAEEQNNNKRSNIFFEHNGTTLTLKQWSIKYNMDVSTLWYRIFKSKNSFKDAITKKNRFEASNKINKEEAAKMLLNGDTVAKVARYFKVTDKVITPLRNKLGIKPHKNQYS